MRPHALTHTAPWWSITFLAISPSTRRIATVLARLSLRTRRTATRRRRRTTNRILTAVRLLRLLPPAAAINRATRTGTRTEIRTRRIKTKTHRTETKTRRTKTKSTAILTKAVAPPRSIPVTLWTTTRTLPGLSSLLLSPNRTHFSIRPFFVWEIANPTSTILQNESPSLRRTSQDRFCTRGSSWMVATSKQSRLSSSWPHGSSNLSLSSRPNSRSS
mmetsp:Transcript_40459/g.101836  ORF Transcript_40459/g.101836 Transcript_40459/m.101836 type:complete len:217 (-) Transcript_40459:287-937(-)